MAVGYDLNDDASPYGPVHFRDKQDVGRRLAQSALANVYGTILSVCMWWKATRGGGGLTETLSAMDSQGGR